MADQSQPTTTTSNTTSEPVLCKLGCGFFGNNATEGYCSKCWRDFQKSQQQQQAKGKDASQTDDKTNPSMDAVPHGKPTGLPLVVTPLDGEISDRDRALPCWTEPKNAKMIAPMDVATTSTKKKSKKKSYKHMMASMIQNQSPSSEKDANKETEIRNVTGGGAFKKIDKI